jgi:ABC-type branched-subunit amino acid transport system substrate-binding protein
MTLFRRIIQKSWPVLIILALGLSACGQAAVVPCAGVKVGILLTNAEGAAKTELQAGYNEALKDVNVKGILNGCKVEAVLPKNTKTTNEDIAKDVQDLVDQGALAIVSAQDNDASKRMAKVSRYLQVPVIVSVDTGDEIIDTGDSSWFVRINPSNSSYPASMYKYILGKQMVVAPRIAIIFEQSEYGESSAVEAGNAALDNNLSIGLYQRFSPFLTDFKEITDLLAKADPAINVVILISTHPEQASDLLKEVSDVRTTLGANLAFDTIFGLGSGFTSRDFLYDASGALNLLPGNLVLVAPWWGDSKFTGYSQCTQAVLPTAGLGTIQTPVVRNVQGYVSMRLAINALEQTAKKASWQITDKVKVTDWKEMLRTAEYLPLFRSDLAQTIRATKTCQMGSPLWPISFNGFGQNQLTPLLIQLKDGKLITIAPSP